MTTDKQNVQSTCIPEVCTPYEASVQHSNWQPISLPDNVLTEEQESYRRGTGEAILKLVPGMSRNTTSL